jgi:hypothetical protein
MNFAPSVTVSYYFNLDRMHYFNLDRMRCLSLCLCVFIGICVCSSWACERKLLSRPGCGLHRAGLNGRVQWDLGGLGLTLNLCTSQVSTEEFNRLTQNRKLCNADGKLVRVFAPVLTCIDVCEPEAAASSVFPSLVLIR